MTQPIPQPDAAFDCLFNTIIGFLLPFFLVGAGGNPQVARATIAQLINAYKPGTTTELDLAGRIVGFGTVAMDNLMMSLSEDLPDTKVLQYRSNAVALSRAAEQARQILQALQNQQEITKNTPHPKIVATPPVPAPSATPPAPSAAQPTPAKPAPAKPAPTAPQQLPPTVQTISAIPPMDIESMKRDARIMMAAFSRQSANEGAAIRMTPDPAAAITAAVRAAVTAAQQPSVAAKPAPNMPGQTRTP